MKVSVIIPVYNAANYVEEAVLSALDQEETGEVILVEDGSTDNSFAICKKLTEEYPQVSLFTHSNRENRGPGASRNLGMKMAKEDFIAFLDADDWFLPGRFKEAKEIFKKNPKADGTFGAAIYYFPEIGHFPPTKNFPKNGLRNIIVPITPDQLFKYQLIADSGYFSIITLIVKKAIIHKIGWFDENLKLCEDTDWILRLSLKASIYQEKLNSPVSKIRIHAQSLTTHPKKNKYYRKMFYRKWWDLMIKNQWAKCINRNIVSQNLELTIPTFFSVSPYWFIRLLKLGILLCWVCQSPIIIKKIY